MLYFTDLAKKIQFYFDRIGPKKQYNMLNKIRKAIFRIRWLIMSERSKYRYLLARSEEHDEFYGDTMAGDNDKSKVSERSLPDSDYS